MSLHQNDNRDMLLSVLIELRAASNCLILGPLGIPARSWFLEQVKLFDPILSSELHDDPGVKPYTVSTLLDDEGFPLGPGRTLEPGDSCWIKVTSYSGKLSKLIYEKIIKDIQSKPKTVSIFQMRFLAHDCTINPHVHPLANKTTYHEIAQRETFINPKKQFHLHFLSPTAFRSHGLDLPLPIPEFVYSNYFEKWNRYCPENMQIGNDWVDFVKAHIKINKFIMLQTLEWLIPGENKYGQNEYQKITGYKGKVVFVLSKKQRLNQEVNFWKDTLAVLHALSDFAIYCGTGQHTTVGMGQTKIIESG